MTHFVAELVDSSAVGSGGGSVWVSGGMSIARETGRMKDELTEELMESVRTATVLAK